MTERVGPKKSEPVTLTPDLLRSDTPINQQRTRNVLRIVVGVGGGRSTVIVDRPTLLVFTKTCNSLQDPHPHSHMRFNGDQLLVTNTSSQVVPVNSPSTLSREVRDRSPNCNLTLTTSFSPYILFNQKFRGNIPTRATEYEQ